VAIDARDKFGPGRRSLEGLDDDLSIRSSALLPGPPGRGDFRRTTLVRRLDVDHDVADLLPGSTYR
jgi:hypothetical protein